VFVGGCTAEAAEAVCAEGKRNKAKGKNEDDDAPLLPFHFSLLPLLEALLEHSLLRQEIGADGAPRFRMLETIREYTLERLALRGEMETLRRAHAAYYLELAESAEPRLQGADQTAWLDRLEEEHRVGAEKLAF